MKIDRLLADSGCKPGVVAEVKRRAGGSAMMLSKGLGVRASRLSRAWSRGPSAAWNAAIAAANTSVSSTPAPPGEEDLCEGASAGTVENG
jgi:hypothetical protein